MFPYVEIAKNVILSRFWSKIGGIEHTYPGKLQMSGVLLTEISVCGHSKTDDKKYEYNEPKLYWKINRKYKHKQRSRIRSFFIEFYNKFFKNRHLLRWHLSKDPVGRVPIVDICI